MFAAVHVPNFPFAAVLRAEPELREQAVAVVEGTPPLVHVIAVNDKAGEAGVEPGMTRLQAEERLSAAASVQGRAAYIRQRSEQREAAAHAALLDCACGFSPRVEDTAPGTVVLDLAGLERIFGPPEKIARDLTRRCTELDLEANVAVAANPDAAMLAACGFTGVTVIAPGQEAERLGSLLVDVLIPAEGGRATYAESGGVASGDRIAEDLAILETLDRWGVRHLRALALLPEVAVAERLGPRGLHLQQLARGTAQRSLVPREPPLVFEEAMELDYPVDLLEPLSFLLNRMLEQLCARLAARALATTELRLRLELDPQADIENPTPGQGEAEENLMDCGIAELPNCGIEIGMAEGRNPAPLHSSHSSSYKRTLRLPVAMLDAKVFLKLVQLDLQSHPPGAPVTKIWLSAEPAEPRRTQNGLFLPQAPEPEKLELTLARIARVVRAEPRVGSPEILDTHRPDAFCMKKFAPPAAGKAARTSSPGEDARPNVTALRMFRPPLTAAITLRDGRPAHLACVEKPALRGDVVWCAGPWRSSSDWWSEQNWAREEWDMAVHNEEGIALYRVYRDEAGNRWFVEGTYD